MRNWEFYGSFRDLELVGGRKKEAQRFGCASFVCVVRSVAMAAHYALTLTPVVADGAVEPEPLDEVVAKLGRNCRRSDCSEV
jgi:hypothetical protein